MNAPMNRTEYFARLTLARNLAARLKCKLADRIGTPMREIVVKETVSEKTRRILAECDMVTGRTLSKLPR